MDGMSPFLKTAAGIAIEMEEANEWVTVKPSLLVGDYRYVVQVEGASMMGAGIQDGTICLIRSASIPVHGQIILAFHGNQFTLKFVKEDSTDKKRRYHLYYVDGTKREILVEEDGEKRHVVGRFVRVIKEE